MNASEAIARMSTAANFASTKTITDDCESWRKVPNSGSPEPSIKSKRSRRRLNLRPQIKLGLSFLSTASSVVSSPREELSEEELLDPENRAWV